MSFQLHGLCCLSPFNCVASLLLLYCRAASLLFLSVLLYQLISSFLLLWSCRSPLLILHMEGLLNFFLCPKYMAYLWHTIWDTLTQCDTFWSSLTHNSPYPATVSNSFWFLWEKRWMLLRWDRCMQFWLPTKAKKLHQYNMLALGRRRQDQGRTEVWVNCIDPAAQQ